MSAAIVIPARFASTRYPGKPLVELKGADGTSKPLIQRTWDTAQAVPGIDRIVVATDDDRIADRVRAFGGTVVMTDDTLANGTERCAQAIEEFDPVPEIIVNLQGDAPLTPPWFIEDLVAALRSRPEFDVATPVLRCDPSTLAHFRADRAEGRVGGTTAVFGHDGSALYFSKEVLPYVPAEDHDAVPVFHHVGVYAYRPGALERYRTWPAGPLEISEGLEQLRFLENGARVLCVEVEAKGRVFWELNNPIDVTRIESVL